MSTKSETARAPKYVLTEEHRQQMKPWADKWIANALSCETIGPAEQDVVRKAVVGLYGAAKLEPPAPDRIAFVPSPIVGATASCIAAGTWWIRDNPDQCRGLFGFQPDELDLAAACREACRRSTAVVSQQAPRQEPSVDVPGVVERALESALQAAAWDAAAATWHATRGVGAARALEEVAAHMFRSVDARVADVSDSVFREVRAAAEDVARGVVPSAGDVVQEVTGRNAPALVAELRDVERALEEAITAEVKAAISSASHGSVSHAVARGVVWYDVARGVLDAVEHITGLVAEVTSNAAEDVAQAAARDAVTPLHSALDSVLLETDAATGYEDEVAVESAVERAVRGIRHAFERAITGDDQTQRAAAAVQDAATDAVNKLSTVHVSDASKGRAYRALMPLVSIAAWNAVENLVGSVDRAGMGEQVANEVLGAARSIGAAFSQFNDGLHAAQVARGTRRRAIVNFLMSCIGRWGCLWNGGNMWAGWVAHLSFFRHVVKLPLDYTNWAHYEQAAYAGPRFMHSKFCLVSDRPEVLRQDEQHRPHCADGPSHRWRDGWELYYFHGVKVPKRVVMAPESYTAEEIRAERNSEVLRVLAERLGWGRFLDLLGVRCIDSWHDPSTGLDYELLDAEDRRGELQPRFLRMRSPALHDGSQPWFVEPVDPGLETAQAARKWQVRLSRDPAARYYRHGDVVVTYAEPDSLYWPSVEECNQNPELVFQKEA